MFWWLAASVAAALLAGAFWDDIREGVAAGLRDFGLNRSVLMDAWIQLDRLVGHVRSRVFVKTKKGKVIEISERTFSLDEIDDPEIRRVLRNSRHYKKNVLELIE